MVAVRGQSLDDSAKMYGVSWLLPIADVKVWDCGVRLVMVMVRVEGALVEVSMPKSSSLGRRLLGWVV